MKILKKIVAATVAAGIAATAAGCTNYDKMMKDEPTEYISMAAENSFKAAVGENCQILADALEEGNITLSFEVEGVTVSAECYTAEEKGAALVTLSAGENSARLYGYADKDKLKFGLGEHVHDVPYDGLEEKLAKSIFAPESGSDYALEQSEYDQLLEYAAMLRDGEDNAYLEIISGFADAHPPVTEKDVEITVGGETVKANTLTYEVGTEDMKSLLSQLFAQYIADAGDEAEYSQEDFDEAMASIRNCSGKAYFAVDTADNTLAACDITVDMTTYDDYYEEEQTARVYMNYGGENSGSLVIGVADGDDVMELRLDGSRSETGCDVKISVNSNGETTEVGTISCVRNGDNYTIFADIPELEMSAKVEGTITSDKNSLTVTVDKLSATSGASEVSYAPKGVITFTKGGTIPELDAEMEFLDITEEQLEAMGEEFGEQFNAVIESSDTDGAVLDTGKAVTGYVDGSDILLANSNAKTVYNAVSANFIERGINGYGLPGSDFTGDGAFILIDGQLDDLSDYTGDDFYGNSYGEYNSDEYSVEYVLWSKSDIPEEYRSQLTSEEQEALAEQGTVIGCWPLS